MPLKMTNPFDHIFFDNNTSKSDKVITTLFSIGVGLLNYNFLALLSWEHLIKSAMVLAGAVITAVSIKIGQRFYEVHLDHRLFKKKKNEKEKDNQRAA